MKLQDKYTVSWQEDIAKFPNGLNSIPNKYLSLKKENKQKIFCKYIWKKNVNQCLKIAGRGLNS